MSLLGQWSDHLLLGDTQEPSLAVSRASELDGTDVGEREADSTRARSGQTCDPWVRGLEAPGEHGVSSVALMALSVRAG